MKTFEVKITKEVYTKDFGWIVKNESLIIEAENKEDAYFEASAKEEQYHKGYCKAVEDICNSLKVLDSRKAVLKKNE